MTYDNFVRRKAAAATATNESLARRLLDFCTDFLPAKKLDAFDNYAVVGRERLVELRDMAEALAAKEEVP